MKPITFTGSHDVRESCQDGGIWLWLSGLISIMQLWIALLATFCKVFHLLIGFLEANAMGHDDICIVISLLSLENRGLL